MRCEDQIKAAGETELKPHYSAYAVAREHIAMHPPVALVDHPDEADVGDRFVDRIIFLEGHPNLQVLDPLRIGENVREIIEADLAAEIGAQALYQ